MSGGGNAVDARVVFTKASADRLSCTVFAQHGLVKIDPTLGEKFDPNFHEVLF